MMFLGNFEFEIDKTAYDKITKNWASNIAKIARNDNVDALQFRGTKNQVLTITGAVFPRHSGISQNTIENLHTMRGVPLPLTTGKYEFLGVYHLENIQVTSEDIVAQHVVQQQKYNIKLIQIPTPSLLSLI